MSPGTFTTILNDIKPFLDSQSIASTPQGRSKIPDSTRLGVFLVYIGRDPNYFTVGLVFGVSETSVIRIVIEVAFAIKYKFNNKMQPAQTFDDLHNRSSEFNNVSIFENVICAIDGVHFPVAINDKNSYTSYYNHKGFYFLNAICLVDASCRFMLASIPILCYPRPNL